MGNRFSNLSLTNIFRFFFFPPTDINAHSTLYGDGIYRTYYGGPPVYWHTSETSDPTVAWLQRVTGMIQEENIPSKPEIQNAQIISTLFHVRKSTISLDTKSLILNLELMVNLDNAYLSVTVTDNAQQSEKCFKEQVKRGEWMKSIKLQPLEKSLSKSYHEEINLIERVDIDPSVDQITVQSNFHIQNPSVYNFNDLPIFPNQNTTNTYETNNTTNINTNNITNNNSNWTIQICIIEKDKKDISKLTREETIVYVNESFHIESSKQILYANISHLLGKKRDKVLKKFVIADVFQQHTDIFQSSSIMDEIPLHAVLPTVGSSTVQYNPKISTATDEIQDPCVICISEPSTCIPVPCRHLCMCKNCSQALIEQNRSIHRCPLCRSDISTIIDMNPT